MHNLHGGKLYKHSKTYAPVIIMEEIVKIRENNIFLYLKA